MMAARKRKQDAVYWGNPTAEGDGGYTYSDPVEIKVRWQTQHEQFRTPTGREETSQAVVYVGQDVAIGGYLFLGTLDDLDSGEESNPESVREAYPVRGFSSSPTLRNTDTWRKVWL